MTQLHIFDDPSLAFIHGYDDPHGFGKQHSGNIHQVLRLDETQEYGAVLRSLETGSEGPQPSIVLSLYLSCRACATTSPSTQIILTLCVESM